MQWSILKPCDFDTSDRKCAQFSENIKLSSQGCDHHDSPIDTRLLYTSFEIPEITVLGPPTWTCKAPHIQLSRASR